MGSPYSQHGILWQTRGEPQYLETFRAGAADPGSTLSRWVYWKTQWVLYYLLSWSVYCSAQLVGRLGSAGVWERDYGWGVRYAALLAHGRSLIT